MEDDLDVIARHTRAPSAAKASTIALPMPLVPPVTKQVFPSQYDGISDELKGRLRVRWSVTLSR